MIRHTTITTLEEADDALESLVWLLAGGRPNREVRRLFDVATFYRDAVRRQPKEPKGEEKKPSFAERIEQKRKG
jgi:hypothetical protein